MRGGDHCGCRRRPCGPLRGAYRHVGRAATAGVAAREITVAAMTAERVNCDDLSMAPLWSRATGWRRRGASLRSGGSVARNARVTACGTVGGQVAATDFRILGPLEVAEGGRPVGLAGARQRALLAILLLHAGEAVSSRPADRRAVGRRAARRPARRRCACASRSCAGRWARPASCSSRGRRATRWRSRPSSSTCGASSGSSRRATGRCAGDDPAAAAEQPARGAGAVARAAAGGLQLRAVRPGGDRAPARSCGWRRSSCASRPSSRSATTRGWSASCRRSSSSIRCASGCAASSCSRSTATAARPTRWRPTAPRGAGWSTRSGSSRARSCTSSSGGSSPRTRRLMIDAGGRAAARRGPILVLARRRRRRSTRSSRWRRSSRPAAATSW